MLLSTALMCFVKFSTSSCFNFEQGIIHIPEPVVGCNPWKKGSRLFHVEIGQNRGHTYFLHVKITIVLQRSSKANMWSGLKLVLWESMLSCSSCFLTVLTALAVGMHGLFFEPTNIFNVGEHK